MSSTAQDLKKRFESVAEQANALSTSSSAVLPQAGSRTVAASASPGSSLSHPMVLPKTLKECYELGMRYKNDNTQPKNVRWVNAYTAFKQAAVLGSTPAQAECIAIMPVIVKHWRENPYLSLSDYDLSRTSTCTYSSIYYMYLDILKESIKNSNLFSAAEVIELSYQLLKVIQYDKSSPHRTFAIANLRENELGSQAYKHIEESTIDPKDIQFLIDTFLKMNLKNPYCVLSLAKQCRNSNFLHRSSEVFEILLDFTQFDPKVVSKEQLIYYYLCSQRVDPDFFLNSNKESWLRYNLFKKIEFSEVFEGCEFSETAKSSGVGRESWSHYKLFKQIEFSDALIGKERMDVELFACFIEILEIENNYFMQQSVDVEQNNGNTESDNKVSQEDIFLNELIKENKNRITIIQAERQKKLLAILDKYQDHDLLTTIEKQLVRFYRLKLLCCVPKTSDAEDTKLVHELMTSLDTKDLFDEKDLQRPENVQLPLLKRVLALEVLCKKTDRRLLHLGKMRYDNRTQAISDQQATAGLKDTIPSANSRGGSWTFDPVRKAYGVYLYSQFAKANRCSSTSQLTIINNSDQELAYSFKLSGQKKILFLRPSVSEVFKSLPDTGSHSVSDLQISRLNDDVLFERSLIDPNCSIVTCTDRNYIRRGYKHKYWVDNLVTMVRFEDDLVLEHSEPTEEMVRLVGNKMQQYYNLNRERNNTDFQTLVATVQSAIQDECEELMRSGQFVKAFNKIANGQ